MTVLPSRILRSHPQISQNAAQQITTFQHLFLFHGKAHRHRLLLPRGVTQEHPAHAVMVSNWEEVRFLWRHCWCNRHERDREEVSHGARRRTEKPGNLFLVVELLVLVILQVVVVTVDVNLGGWRLRGW